MYPKVKTMEKREDGFLEIKLKKVSDFDDYLFHKLYEDEHCFSCKRDPLNRCIFYYDTNGYIPLSSYLEHHVFLHHEFLNFMIFLMEGLVEVNATKPVYLNTQYIYLSLGQQHVKFVVLPIKLDGWMFNQTVMKQFIKQVLKYVKTKSDYETVGILLQEVKEKDFSFPILLQALHEMYAKTKIKKHWWQHKDKTEVKKYYNLEGIYAEAAQVVNPCKEEDQQMKVCEDGIKYQTQVIESLQQDATVVLFHPNSNGYLQNQETMECYPLQEQDITIGRSFDNDIVINHAGVSSYHAVIHPMQHELTDLKSMNGTFVNGEKIAHHLLKDQDKIQIANDSFIYYQKPYEG